MQCQHQQRDHHDLNDDSGQSGDKGGREEHLKAIGRSRHPHQYGVGQTGDDASAQHGGQQGEVYIPPETAVENTGEDAVGAKLQHHGRGGGEQGRHLGEERGKQGSEQAANRSPGPTAEKPAQQHRQVHGEKLAAAAKGMEYSGKQQTQGNAQGGKYQVSGGFHSRHGNRSFRFEILAGTEKGR